MEQRFKAMQQSYSTILTLEASEQPQAGAEASRPQQSEVTPDRATHAGGVVFRIGSVQTEYLLVQTKKYPTHWVLPKGHIESDEDEQRTAIREVKEETGVWARIKKELRLIDYTLADTAVRVRFFLVESVEEGRSEDRWRKHQWFPLNAEILKASDKETQELLQLAENERIAAETMRP
jgi:8-oxo-dGTP pyrophosphatase MutT (NUDIX family)